MRSSGVLMPIFSLPSKYGIGCFSKEAYDFIDKLNKAKQKYWQILPLGPTGYGDSPYQSFSTFAGNPYFIDLETLIEEGLLTNEDCTLCDFGDNTHYVNYEKIYNSRFKVLKIAFKNSHIDENEDFKKFKLDNAFWMDDYSLFMAIKSHFNDKSWIDWDEEAKTRDNKTLEKYRDLLSEDILFYEFVQYMFMKQWTKLRSYANSKGVKIIGDIPIYVAFDSADSWSNPMLFQFDSENNPIAVAGCPPDGFSATGQLWGNPLYNWDYHKKTDFKWWINRIKYCMKLYDVVRIDHFRGFDEYYSIPYGAETAATGHWEKGPGIDLFNVITKELGQVDIIAEDLGYVTDTVKKLVEDSGYPSMKLIQFAFDSRESGDYMPHNYTKNCVVYTGTHDNDTIIGWYDTISQEDKKIANDYMNNKSDDNLNVNWDFIRVAFGSVANMVIIPIQDYLGLGSEGRMNKPSVLGGNWSYRIETDDFSDEIINKIAHFTKLYER